MTTKNNIYIVVLIATFIFAYGNVSNAQINPNGCNPSGANASALGHLTTASGINSFSNGLHAFAEGHTSSAIGYEVTASGDYSIALGRYLQVTPNESFVIGTGISTNLPLINNVGGIMLGTGSHKPTMFISAAIPNRTGSVGIGNVTDPQAKLHIKGDESNYFPEDASILLEPGSDENEAVIRFWDNDKFISVNHDGRMEIESSSLLLSNHVSFGDESHNISVGDNGVMQIDCENEDEIAPIMVNGIVGINVENVNKLRPGCSLYVGGKVIAEEVSIKAYNQWPDFVFGKGYQLMPLNELKHYVNENSHLPEVPTEAEVNENGIDVAGMQGILLKKIEELTLYTIQLQEQVDQLQQKVSELEAK